MMSEPKRLKDHEISYEEIARRILIMENMAQVEARISSLKSSIIQQKAHEHIIDQFETIEFIIGKVHDIIVMCKHDAAALRKKGQDGKTE